MTETGDVEIYRGALLRVVAVREANGRCQAAEFLATLRSQQKPAYAQFKVRLTRLADQGHLRNPEAIRPIQDGREPTVWEVKAPDGPGWRLYGIRDGDTWYFTHGRKKPGDRKVPAEAAKARTIYRDRST